MKLSDYAKKYGITYKTAWNRFKAGKIKGAYKNADINASRNIGVRSSNPMKYYSRRSVLRMLVRAYLSDAKHHACSSRAMEVILSNKYFIGYYEPIKITPKRNRRVFLFFSMISQTI